jgi:hypothetical protein
MAEKIEIEQIGQNDWEGGSIFVLCVEFYARWFYFIASLLNTKSATSYTLQAIRVDGLSEKFTK